MKKILLYSAPILLILLGFWLFNHISAWVGYILILAVIIYYGFIIEKLTKENDKI